MPNTLAGLTRWVAAPALTAVLLATSVAPAAQAQPRQGWGTVRGIVYDSLTRRPLAGAVVEVQETARITYADVQGRFTLDSVPFGAQQLTFSSPALDSLGLFGFARTIDVGGDTRGVLLATPSFRTMHGQLCPATDSPPRDSAIVFGTVYDATNRAPIHGAQVVLRWYETDGKSSGLQLRAPQRTASTDADGVYGICGVPADLALNTAATHDSASSGVFSTVVGPGRILRRDLYLSRELGDLSAASASGSPLQGTGVVRGSVRDERGRPLVGAIVVLTTADRTTNTDSAGRYHFTNVPLGTQELSIRQIGRGALYRIIDVTARETGPHDFVLTATTMLAAVNVRGASGMGADQAGYLQRKKQGFAKFVEHEEIQKRYDIGSALKRIPGLRVSQDMGVTHVTSSRPLCSGQVPIVIDGIPMQSRGNNIVFGGTSDFAAPPGRSDAGMISPSSSPVSPVNNARLDQLAVNDVIAIEYHPGPATVPMEYWPGPPPQCGLILIWTVFSRWNR